MADDDQRPIVVCSAIWTGPAAVPSRVFFCTECGERIWVSRALTPLVMRGEAVPLCNPCSLRTITDLGGDVEWKIHPDQVTELAENNIREFSQEVAEAMREREQQ